MHLDLAPLAVGATVWVDASAPNFAAVADRIVNGELGEVQFWMFGGGGGGGLAGREPFLLGGDVGPGGVDLAGYRITRIGFRVDALTVDSPGQDLGGDGIWTDVTLRGTWLFEGSVASKDACKNDGWKDFAVFKNQGDCVSFVATEGKNQPSVTTG